jgi:hypothetical protein
MRAENQNRPSCSCWCGKRQLFLSALSLCLSRACLGKMIVFIYKWLKKAVFCRVSSALWPLYI